MESILIVDVESTCWSDDEDRALYYRSSEIIEIGCVPIIGGVVKDGIGVLIRPIIVPVLSDFCTNLTGIKQVDVDNGVEYLSALEYLDDRLSEYGTSASQSIMVSWGEYDWNMFKLESKRRAIPYPFRKSVNLKKVYGKLGYGRRVSMMEALSVLGIEHTGTHHRGLSDAENIARIYIALNNGVSVVHI
jgi:inhibitor of KinA sporulation pathway (predicted exonuclease)